MNDDRIIAAIWLAGGIALAGSALVHRRLSGRRSLMLVLVWLAIILGAWGAVALIGRIAHYNFT